MLCRVKLRVRRTTLSLLYVKTSAMLVRTHFVAGASSLGIKMTYMTHLRNHNHTQRYRLRSNSSKRQLDREYQDNTQISQLTLLGIYKLTIRKLAMLKMDQNSPGKPHILEITGHVDSKLHEVRGKTKTRPKSMPRRLKLQVAMPVSH